MIFAIFYIKKISIRIELNSVELSTSGVKVKLDVLAQTKGLKKERGCKIKATETEKSSEYMPVN